LEERNGEKKMKTTLSFKERNFVVGMEFGY
jgi:hypothetical protein